MTAGRIDFIGVLSMLPVVRIVEYSCGVFYAQGGERVQIPEGRAYIKNLYQAYNLLKKNKSAQMSTCRHFSNLSCFPTKQKTQQTSRQTVSRFGFLGHSIPTHKLKVASRAQNRCFAPYLRPWEQGHRSQNSEGRN